MSNKDKGNAGLALNPYGSDFAEMLIGEPWMADGICSTTDPESFFPEKGGSTKAAKRICNGGPNSAACPVRDLCLQYALDREERFGIWGGVSERERRRIKRGLSPQARRNVVGHFATCSCKACIELGEAA